MHILLLNDDALPTAQGGAAVIVESLRKAFANLGHTVTLITTHQDAARKKEDRSSDAYGQVISFFVPAPKYVHWTITMPSPLSGMLDRVMSEVKPDIVNAHNIHTFLTYDALRIAHKHTEKIFLTAHDTFLVSFARVGGQAYEQDALQGKPYRMHVWDHLKIGRQYSPLRNRAIRKILNKHVRKVIALSRATEVFLNANRITNTQCIHNGLDLWAIPEKTDVDAFRSKHNLRGPTIAVGGRMSGDKGLDVLLPAMAKVLETIPTAELMMIGAEERVRSYLPLASKKVRDAVRITGWLPREEIHLALAAADVITTPSTYLDNFPTMNLEAMIAGKPVVGTCFGGTPEVVQDSVTGIIVNPRNIDALSSAIIKFFTDEALAKRMGMAGRERVEKEFSVQEQAKKYLALFIG